MFCRRGAGAGAWRGGAGERLGREAGCARPLGWRVGAVDARGRAAHSVLCVEQNGSFARPTSASGGNRRAEAWLRGRAGRPDAPASVVLTVYSLPAGVRRWSTTASCACAEGIRCRCKLPQTAPANRGGC